MNMTIVTNLAPDDDDEAILYDDLLTQLSD